MPLVQFNYNQHTGEIPPSTPLNVDNRIMRVQLPRQVHNKKWTIRSIRAEYDSGKAKDSVPFRWLEVELPELMRDNQMFYSLNSVGGTRTPSRNLRFYVNRFQSEQASVNATSGINEPVRKSVVVNPDLNLGVHRLDELELTCIVTARNGGDPNITTPLLHYSIILEYE